MTPEPKLEISATRVGAAIAAAESMAEKECYVKAPVDHMAGLVKLKCSI